MWRALRQLLFGPDWTLPSVPDDAEPDLSGPVDVPITDEIDLHTFRPKDVKDVLEGYLEACREKGILSVRIVHGKGKGVLRETVHRYLDTREDVLDYGLAPEGMGSWGATIAQLAPLPPEK